MYGEPGEFYFHYTDRVAAFEHILPSGQLRLSPYPRMRDPLEAGPWTFGGSYFSSNFDPVPDDSPDHPDQIYFEANRVAAAIKAQTKLLSVSTDAPNYDDFDEPFGRGWASARLWEHRAEQHSGVCLVFRRDRLDLAVRQWADAHAAALWAKPVRYTPSGLVGEPGATNFLIERFKGAPVHERVVEHLERHHEALFFTKLSDWETEWEFRFVALSDGGDYEYVDYDDALELVVVGHAFPEWQRPGAARTCEAAGADFRRMHWEQQRPHLLTGYPPPKDPARPATDA